MPCQAATTLLADVEARAARSGNDKAEKSGRAGLSGPAVSPGDDNVGSA